MKHLTNIEKSAFRKGEYVGYSDGVWAIRSADSFQGKWEAAKRGTYVRLYAPTLERMSEMLSQFEAASPIS